MTFDLTIQPISGWSEERNCWLHPPSFAKVYEASLDPDHLLLRVVPHRHSHSVSYLSVKAQHLAVNDVVVWPFPTGEQFGIIHHVPSVL